MPFSAGTYSPAIDFSTEAGSPPVPIADLDTQMTDIATALSNCILRDGTGVPTSAQDFNGVAITGAGQITGSILHATSGGSDSYETYNSINLIRTIGTYESGTFTGTATGLTTAPTCTVHWSRSANLVTLAFPGLTGTSNTTSHALTGMPANLQPARTQRGYAVVVDSGNAQAGMVSVQNGTGTITFFFGSTLTNTGFTNSGTKGTSTFSFTYSLD